MMNGSARMTGERFVVVWIAQYPGDHERPWWGNNCWVSRRGGQ